MNAYQRTRVKSRVHVWRTELNAWGWGLSAGMGLGVGRGGGGNKTVIKHSIGE